MCLIRCFILFLILNGINFQLFSQVQSNFTRLTATINNNYYKITQVLEDDYNNFWMVSEDGLIKYNGYYFISISLQDIFGQESQNDNLKSIVKDNNGKIWALSSEGLVARQNAVQQFQLFENLDSYKAKAISSKGNEVWISDERGLIYTYNILTDLRSIIIDTQIKDIDQILINDSNIVFLRTLQNKIFGFSSVDQNIQQLNLTFDQFPDLISVTIDNDGYLWIGTSERIYRYKFENNEFVKNNSFKDVLDQFDSNFFISMYCDNANNLYFGTDGDGFYKFSLDQVTLDHYKYNPGDKFSLSTNTVLSFYEDSSKNLWVLTHYGNINILPYSPNKIDYYTGTESNFTTRVLSICKSSENELWIGTSGEGITKYDQKTGKVKQYKIDELATRGLYAFSIVEDAEKKIWVGTYQNGVWIYDSKTDSFSRLKNSDSKSHRENRFLFNDNKERIWVPSSSSLRVYDSTQNLLADFPLNCCGLVGEVLECMVQDSSGTIWIGLRNGGLYKLNENEFNLQESSFTKKAILKDSLPSKFSIFSISAIDDILWFIGNGALYKYNIKTDAVDSYSDFPSFLGIGLKNVVIENAENIWISSDSGVWHFNDVHGVAENYLYVDGFKSRNYMFRSSLKDNLGKIYFGGVNGLDSFYPENLVKENKMVKLNINAIDILNKPASLIIPDQIIDGIEKIKELTLEYNQASIHFRFAAIGNILNPNYYYSYRLKGLDNDEWVYSTNELKAVYTSLPPGKYTFELRAGTKKGLWDIGTKEVHITINKPWWLKPWAVFIYIILGLLIIYGFYLRSYLKNKLINEELKNNSEKEINKLKMSFFAKMSHEIQTPLTLILGPIEELLTSDIQGHPSKISQKLKIIYNNAKRLSKIANQLTTVRNRELGRLKLQVTRSNLVHDVNEILMDYNDLALVRGVNFKTTVPKSKLDLWYDKDKLELILCNLLSNAFKFTPKGGEIIFSVEYLNSNTEVRFLIKDSGPGIPEDELEKIFELFYQSKIGMQHKGMGIGLALVKELVEIHHGTITVRSNLSGTTFEVVIPTTESLYSQGDELINGSAKNFGRLENIVTDIFQPIQEEFISPAEKRKTILIIDDNYDLQLFLLNVFKANYNVLMAENGEDGISLAEKHLPDLIISDVMMPKMDGLNLCRKLQGNLTTVHIPIILITVKNSYHSKIEGLTSGAIEYICKPFGVNELVIKVHNIISSQQHIREKQMRELITSPRIEISKSQEDQFIELLVQEIENGMKTPNFKLSDLSEVLRISQTTLYRKCVQLTGKSLVDFVRFIRLKKAAVIIAKYKYSVSEAAFMVGFNDSKYFSKCFKKEFGITPKKFQLEAAKRNVDSFLNEYNLIDMKL